MTTPRVTEYLVGRDVPYFLFAAQRYELRAIRLAIEGRTNEAKYYALTAEQFRAKAVGMALEVLLAPEEQNRVFRAQYVDGFHEYVVELKAKNMADARELLERYHNGPYPRSLVSVREVR